ncbi:hypothetical protein K488DRAFT_78101 [Vararia minispora EC-137]|uniref:Uncharacterized protein n=1 Tax=Vararia minispora EC-137 TaxID=1314806 RepID=A0ACB8QN50_9AGAM|nr:hypothetical protein K488DRAFT_78101 [Vararia minispora EC-137]
MSFFDRIKEGVSRVVPDSKGGAISTSSTGGIGNGRGAVGFEDDMIVSKPIIVCHACQIFFAFIAMCCFASVASFQAKWKVGPSGLTGFALFVAIFTMFLAAGLLAVPVVYEKYDRLTRLARVLKEARVSFIFGGTGTSLTLLIAFITTISAWTEAGCKDASKDPHADLGDGFKNGLSGWCSTKKAGAAFFWFAFLAWAVHFGILLWDWRKGRLGAPRDQPFTRPADQDDADAESVYSAVPAARRDTEDDSPFADTQARFSGAAPTDYSGYSGSAPSPGGYASSPARPRQSVDAYGAFSDPAPSGFDETPRVSRTMQYADPYAAVRASVTSSQQPPTYSEYGGNYR